MLSSMQLNDLFVVWAGSSPIDDIPAEPTTTPLPRVSSGQPGDAPWPRLSLLEPIRRRPFRQVALLGTLRCKHERRSTLDHRESLPSGTLLGGSYRIARVVGSGGFGITYEAEDVHLGTMVAIKEYYPFDFGDRVGTLNVRPKSDRHAKTFEWGRSNFLQEARTLARFEHPSIVRVTRAFEANSTAYMVMRFEQGQSFEEWLRAWVDRRRRRSSTSSSPRCSTPCR